MEELVRYNKEGSALVEVVHAFNPSTQETLAGGALEFEDTLIYGVSSRTAWDP